jgi:probable addiction module antidote protein
MALKLNDFDPARYLETEEDVAEYLNSMMEEGNTELLIAALGDVARARGMSEIARASGLTREALYRALKSDAQPRFDTIVRVCTALGLKLNVEVVH